MFTLGWASQVLLQRSEALMHKLTALGALIAAIGPALLIPSSFAHAQVDGALQYPPPSLGTDVQPPAPAGMVPQIVSPRRIELGVSGSSQPPTQNFYHIHSPIVSAPPARRIANSAFHACVGSINRRQHHQCSRSRRVFVRYREP